MAGPVLLAAHSEGSVAASRFARRAIGRGKHWRRRGRRYAVENAAARHELRREHRLDHARDVVRRRFGAPPFSAARDRDQLRLRQRVGDRPARSAAASRSGDSGSSSRRPPGSPRSPSGCSRPSRRRRVRMRIASASADASASRRTRRGVGPAPARSASRRARRRAAGPAPPGFFASACAISAAFDAFVCSSSRCLSEIARSASSCASFARRDWLRGDDVGVRLRFGRRLPAARFGDFRLHDLDVERVEDEAEVGELARARLADDHGERIVLVLERRRRRRRRWRPARRRVARGDRVAGAPAASARGVGAVLAEKSWSCVSRLIARRPELESRSVSVLSWSASLFEKKRFAAVLISASVSPTETIALASTRTLIGRGVPLVVEVGRLVGDVEVDVDDFARDRRAGGEQRDLLRLARPAVDDRAAVQPAHEADRARLDVAQERRDDQRDDDDDERRRRSRSEPSPTRARHVSDIRE